MPTVMIHHYFTSNVTGLENVVVGTNLPEKEYLKGDEYELTSTWSRVSIADALKIHDRNHPNEGKRWKNPGKPPVQIVLSMDGIPIDNSSGQTLEVLSFKLDHCDQIYAIGVHIGQGKEKNLDRIFDPVIEELKTLNVVVSRVLADSPQRTTLLNMDTVTAYFGCAKCYAKGQSNTEKREKGDRKGASVIWPPETMEKAARTHESWLRDIKASRYEKKNGIKGDTPIRKLVQDVVKQVPLDVFHVVYLGMVKRVVKQILRIKDQGGATGIMKDVKALIDKNIKDTRCIKYPSDFSRRPRPINLAVYKSSEWRNLVTAGFFLFTTALEEFKQPTVNKLWGYFIFLIKAFLLPTELWRELKDSCNLKAIMITFYHLYAKVCKKRTCAPNVHMFYHLLDARDDLEFSQMSTEAFEAAYAILKRCYQVGTKSQGKQMLERLYLLLVSKGQHHSCSRKWRVSPKLKAKYNDALIVTKDHRFYRVEGKLVTGMYAGKRLVLGRFDYPHAPALPFNNLWTHRYLGEQQQLFEISPADVIGKAVLCKNIITLVPREALFG